MGSTYTLQLKTEMSDYFYIQSQLNHLVLTIDGSKRDGYLVMYPAYGGANQLWKRGPDDTLVSKIGLVACISDDWLMGREPNTYTNQPHLYKNDEIKRTKDGKVMEIAKKYPDIGGYVQMSGETRESRQKWKFVPEGEI